MTNEQLKELESKLWDSANALRAYGGIKASDYAVPVLGLIFLRFADNKYSQYEADILKEYQDRKGSRMEETIQKIALAKCGFYLPDNARYNYLLELPGDKSMATALKQAMDGIEEHQDEKYKDVLPRQAYFDIEKKKDDILPELLKTFSDIPKDADGDLFGKIYEYFLGKFAMAEGQKGGEFFTPRSVVRFIVEVIEPYKGKIYDPACGSGGMFVQSATFTKNANRDVNDIYVHGQEYMGETVRLAKMNLMVNNIRGEVMEVNSYETDAYESLGKFDFVMANPPFNVKSVKESTVKDDERFYRYGLPKTKNKKDDKISDANYLWVSLFATSLNKTGRAGFVMPNSASDARSAEKDIRAKVVDSGIVDCMVSMPSNMFLTVTLPATIWFFDKAKVQTDRKDKILFIDARNVYNQIDRAHREWTDEHQQNLATIVRLYRGETDRYTTLIGNYLEQAKTAITACIPHRDEYINTANRIITLLKQYAEEHYDKATPAKRKKLEEAEYQSKLDQLQLLKPAVHQSPNLNHDGKNASQLKANEELTSWIEQEGTFSKEAQSTVQILIDLWKLTDKNIKQKQDKTWTDTELNKADKTLEDLQTIYQEYKVKCNHWHEHISWMQKRFPEGKYQDVVGLCKVAYRSEYVDEQEYSLNAGRYVGVEIEDDKISEEEFKDRIKNHLLELDKINLDSLEISSGLESLRQLILN